MITIVVMDELELLRCIVTILVKYIVNTHSYSNSNSNTHRSCKSNEHIVGSCNGTSSSDRQQQ